MKLKIAQVGSIWENTPPDKYGGTERIVYYLTEGLVKRTHEVTLFACGTAKTSARLFFTYPRSLFSDNISWTNIMYPLLHITQAFDRHEEFDIIHVHLNKSSDYIALPLAVPIRNKTVFTLHFPYPFSQDRIDRHLVLQKYKSMNFVSISNAQRKGGENIHWLDTVYNGIDVNTYSFNPKPKDYLVWIGKFNPDKGVEDAISTAKKLGMKLILAGKIDYLEKQDLEYFKEKIEPSIDGKQIFYIGELDDKGKNKIVGNALAFLNPIEWNEPFGLVMIESLACGTPVIAYNRGAAAEIITDGIDGYIVNNLDQMTKAVKQVSLIKRINCRRKVEEKFTADRMVSNYEQIYHDLLNHHAIEKYIQKTIPPNIRLRI